MKKHLSYPGFMLLLLLGGQSAFAQEKDKKENSPLKQRLEQVKNDPESRERAAQADVYIVKKHRKIYSKRSKKSSNPSS